MKNLAFVRFENRYKRILGINMYFFFTVTIALTKMNSVKKNILVFLGGGEGGNKIKNE